MIKTIIFDLDGTLIESMTSIVSSMNLLLKNKGFTPHTFENYRMFVGDGVEKLVERSIPVAEKDKLEKYTKEYIDIYTKTWRERTVPFDGIVDMLKEFQSTGINLNILSNKRDDLTRLQVRELFSDIRFHNVRGAIKGVPKKPDPSVAMEMMANSGSVPAETVFIGDSGVDMQTGLRGNMTPVGVSWGFRSREELLENGAEFIANNSFELKDYILNNFFL